MYQEVCFNRGTEAGGGGGELMWATRSAPPVILCLLRACILLQSSYGAPHCIKAWFPYDRPDRPDRPSRLKKCSDDREDIMETLPRRSQTTRTTETTLKRSYGNTLRWLRRSGRSKAIPEVITFIPVIDNKFGPDGAEAKKIIQKCSQRVWGLFEIRESPWHQVFEEILCLLNAAKSREKADTKVRGSLYE